MLIFLIQLLSFVSWPSIPKSENKNSVRLLLIADPQLQGYWNEPASIIGAATRKRLIFVNQFWHALNNPWFWLEGLTKKTTSVRIFHYYEKNNDCLNKGLEIRTCLVVIGDNRRQK